MRTISAAFFFRFSSIYLMALRRTLCCSIALSGLTLCFAVASLGAAEPAKREAPLQVPAMWEY
jgi:hypothetical protein